MSKTKSEFVIWNTPCILCILGAIILAALDITGWGWFLFIALLTYTS